MTNTAMDYIYSGYNTTIQSLSYLNPESLAKSAVTAVTTVATAAIDGLSAIYFYPPNIFPEEVAFLDVPVRAFVMVPIILCFVLPAALLTAQLTYEASKAVLDKAGRALCPELYSELVDFIQFANA